MEINEDLIDKAADEWLDANFDCKYGGGHLIFKAGAAWAAEYMTQYILSIQPREVLKSPFVGGFVDPDWRNKGKEALHKALEIKKREEDGL